MHHEISLISTVAVGLGLALVLGFLAARLKLPALVGYIGAGILIGPGTPGFVADMEIASQLAEIGVMLLMFGVGLHFSLDDLLAVKRIAVPAIQVVVRSPNDEEAALLEIGGATRAFVAEQELAQAMLGHVLQVAKPHPAV